MRIGIDARFYGPIGKGLGRYTQKLIENLEKVSGENHQFFVFLKKDNFDEYQPKNKNFQKVLADFHWYTFEEQFKFPRLLKKYKLDLMHFPHFNVPLFYFGKFVVTIHDLILLNFPTVRNTTLSIFLYRLKFLAYKIIIKSAIHRSSRIIAVSRFTKKDILKHYKRIPQEKVKVTYEACDDYCLFNPQRDEKILARYGIEKPYFLYVGNVYPHKNPEGLVKAFERFESHPRQVKLVFVGGEDYFYRRLKEFVKTEKARNITFAGFVPDYDLDLVFRAAVAYLRPSFYEGFELPPLEAMSCGVPVISSDHSCAKEILEDSAHYFDAHDPSDAARAMKEILENENLRAELIEKGFRQVKKYSWRKMTKQTLGLYESIKG